MLHTLIECPYLVRTERPDLDRRKARITEDLHHVQEKLKCDLMSLSKASEFACFANSSTCGGVVQATDPKLALLPFSSPASCFRQQYKFFSAFSAAINFSSPAAATF